MYENVTVTNKKCWWICIAALVILTIVAFALLNIGKGTPEQCLTEPRWSGLYAVHEFISDLRDREQRDHLGT